MICDISKIIIDKKILRFGPEGLDRLPGNDYNLSSAIFLLSYHGVSLSSLLIIEPAGPGTVNAR